MSRTLLILAFVGSFLMACSKNRPLSSRGLNLDERRYYVIQSGYGIEEKVKESFLEGFVCEGMEQELVFQLYGPPDRSIEDDTTWEFIDSQGTLITGIKFEDKKIVKIMGDPRGGLPIGEEVP